MNDLKRFLDSKSFAVAGASANRDKYGNKVVRAYQQKSMTVYPVNPKVAVVEGLKAYPSVAELPDGVEAISIVTPPQVTLSVVTQALERGIRKFWMQPGAENPDAVTLAENAGATVIADGACVLVALGYRE